MKTTVYKKALEPFVHLFWKAQISVLRACPPLSGIINKGVGADRSHEKWIEALFRFAVQAPRALLLHWRDRRKGRVVLSRVSIIVTTRCTLNCENCLARIPELRGLGGCEDIPVDDMVQCIRALLSSIDYLYNLNLSGGEPFLRPDLDEVIRFCAGSGKVGVIDMSTNGTIIPDAKVLAALRETNTLVKISKYADALQPEVKKLETVLKENEIPYMYLAGTPWYEKGALGRRADGLEKRRHSVCFYQFCWPYYNGKLHMCPTSFTMEWGLIPDFKEDYIDLRTDADTFCEQYRKLRKRRVLSACSYCPGYSYKSPKVPVAAQREE